MRTVVAILLAAVSGYTFAADNSGDAAATRGHIVYDKFCAKCHGVNADGRGKDSWKYKPAPTNFHVAGSARPYMEDVTRKGGKGVGRSEDMPDWGDDLSAEQLQDVVSYIMSVRDKH